MVTNHVNVDYVAEECIELIPGFEVDKGSLASFTLNSNISLVEEQIKVNNSNLSDAPIQLADHQIYGSSRLGTKQYNTDSTGNLIDLLAVGQKRYELSNHLGNVLAVVTDQKIPIFDDNNALLHYVPEMVAYNDYYPFGMLVPNRHGGSDYRYGFQGQEKDNEVKGAGNSINYKFRMHDPRVGRFFAVDPLFKEYPHNSSYAFSENIVINAVELEGLEHHDITGELAETAGEIKQDVVNAFEVVKDFVVETFEKLGNMAKSGVVLNGPKGSDGTNSFGDKEQRKATSESSSADMSDVMTALGAMFKGEKRKGFKTNAATRRNSGQTNTGSNGDNLGAAIEDLGIETNKTENLNSKGASEASTSFSNGGIPESVSTKSFYSDGTQSESTNSSGVNSAHEIATDRLKIDKSLDSIQISGMDSGKQTTVKRK